jgi:hypothetical protein
LIVWSSTTQELTDIQELRNALAHYDEDDDRLEDPRWTFERMRTAQQFADRAESAGRSRAPGFRPRGRDFALTGAKLLEAAADVDDRVDRGKQLAPERGQLVLHGRR